MNKISESILSLIKLDISLNHESIKCWRVLKFYSDPRQHLGQTNGTRQHFSKTNGQFNGVTKIAPKFIFHV